MKTGKKVFGWPLAVVMLVSVFAALIPSMKTSAEEGIEKPKITVKRINSGTGVKISISKTKGAAGYYVFITNTENAFSKYMFYNGKYDRKIGHIGKDGTRKRTFTIKGLPKGKYTFRVMAYDADRLYDTYSEEKTIKIKAGKTVEKESKTYDFSNAEVGDVIEFGSYEQDDNMNNGKEAIEWIVLSKDNNQMLVVSKYALDTLPYNNEWKDITWENCTLREWLNKSFYKTAFSKKERKTIKQTTLTNKENSEYGTFGGNNTKDRVFLLSLDDMTNIEYGFNPDYYEEDTARGCEGTAYAVAQVAGTYTMWWLRSPGAYVNYAACAKGNGLVDDWGDLVSCGPDIHVDYYTVRPALYINLNS